MFANISDTLNTCKCLPENFLAPNIVFRTLQALKTHSKYPHTNGFALKYHQNDFEQLFWKVKILHFHWKFQFSKMRIFLLSFCRKWELKIPKNVFYQKIAISWRESDFLTNPVGFRLFRVYSFDSRSQKFILKHPGAYFCLKSQKCNFFMQKIAFWS